MSSHVSVLQTQTFEAIVIGQMFECQNSGTKVAGKYVEDIRLTGGHAQWPSSCKGDWVGIWQNVGR